MMIDVDDLVLLNKYIVGLALCLHQIQRLLASGRSEAFDQVIFMCNDTTLSPGE